MMLIMDRPNLIENSEFQGLYLLTTSLVICKCTYYSCFIQIANRRSKQEVQRHLNSGSREICADPRFVPSKIEAETRRAERGRSNLYVMRIAAHNSIVCLPIIYYNKLSYFRVKLKRIKFGL